MRFKILDGDIDIEPNSFFTCGAVAPSKVLWSAWVPNGNMETLTPHSSETSHVITMNFARLIRSVRRTHLPSLFAKFGWNLPARGRSTHTWNIYFLWVFSCPALLPSFYFSCAPAQAKRIEIISRTMAQKMQFRVRKYSPSKCFLSFDVLGVIFPKTPTISAPVVKSQPNTKSRITSKPFKIYKMWQLNINIKSGSPFQNP